MGAVRVEVLHVKIYPGCLCSVQQVEDDDAFSVVLSYRFTVNKMILKPVGLYELTNDMMKQKRKGKELWIQ